MDTITEPRAHKRSKLLIIGGAVVGAIILILIFKGGADRGESIEAYRQREIAGLNQWLLNNDNPVRQRVESAHAPTITAKGAKVTSFSVQTVDGSNWSGKNGRNIAEVDVVITVNWDGWIQKDGFTELEIDYDNQNKIVKATKYLRSNAAYNWETVDWYKVGFAVGAVIGSL